MKKVILSFLVSSVLFNQGCCSIFTSGKQNISVNSKPDGAAVRMGQHQGVTPCNFTVPKGKDYVIQADYNGKIQTQTLEKNIHPAYWINILIWPGLLVDAATDKMWKYDPEEYYFDFSK